MLAICALALFLVGLDTAIVTVGLPEIGRGVGADPLSGETGAFTAGLAGWLIVTACGVGVLLCAAAAPRPDARRSAAPQRPSGRPGEASPPGALPRLARMLISRELRADLGISLELLLPRPQQTGRNDFHHASLSRIRSGRG